MEVSEDSTMPPARWNRREFLSCSAAAGLALAQGKVLGESSPPRPVRIGFIGLGNRGTSLLRTCLAIPGAEVVALCDAEGKHLARGQAIAGKDGAARPEGYDRASRLLARGDVEAVIVALPCDLHAEVTCEALRAGKAVYLEKPLAPTLAECDRVIAEASRVPALPVHVGFQRRSNLRYQEGVEWIRRGDLGTPIEGRARWVSSNGPVDGHGGWLGSRERSGDWMVEQAVHVWDLFHWIKGDLPARAHGLGRRDLFADIRPGRDVTDHYSVTLEWADGFHANLVHGWAAPADDAFTGASQRVLGTAGGVDFASGWATFRDRSRPRQSLPPGGRADTEVALRGFLEAVRSPEPLAPPVSLAEARAATWTGLLVRAAVDARRVVELAEVDLPDSA